MSTDEVAEVAARPTVTEVIQSLTGFDELAVEKWFKASVMDLNATMTGRALVFVLERRNGAADDKAAYGTAMRLSLKDVDDRFTKEDVDDVDEVEESGKG